MCLLSCSEPVSTTSTTGQRRVAVFKYARRRHGAVTRHRLSTVLSPRPRARTSGRRTPADRRTVSLRPIGNVATDRTRAQLRRCVYSLTSNSITLSSSLAGRRPVRHHIPVHYPGCDQLASWFATRAAAGRRPVCARRVRVAG